MNTKIPCPRCLAHGKPDLQKRVDELLAIIPQELRVPAEVYEARLDACRSCGFLAEETCAKSGYFAELRAAKQNMSCPENNWEK